jgi:gliding motility-associated-like protein
MEPALSAEKVMLPISVCVLSHGIFAPGLYRFDIAGDDGIRLSIDGGASWLLDSFIEQSYNQSFKSTVSQYPNGLCLSGEVNLVIEYFQRPVDSRITFTTVLLSTPVFQPQSANLCEGGNHTFNVGGPTGAIYQWQMSNDGGNTFTDLAETAPYSGVNTANLEITNAPLNINGIIYRCVIDGICNNPLFSDTALITVNPDAKILTQPEDASACPNASARFSVDAGNATNLQWQISNDGGLTFTDLSDNADFSGSNTAELSVTQVTESMQEYLFRCIVKGCFDDLISTPVKLKISENEAEEFVPNVFTPNGDNKNDRFKLIEEGLTDIRFSIYNRWGLELFSWQGFKGEWDGSYKGNPLPDGTYFYLVEAQSECTGTVYKKKGSVNLFR